MCGIFGIVSPSAIDGSDFKKLAAFAEQRGKDSSGIFSFSSSLYSIYRSNVPITDLIDKSYTISSGLAMGHSRLVTNGLADNQPIYRNSVCVIHNGIIVNADKLWDRISLPRLQEIDTEIIAALTADFLDNGGSVNQIASHVLKSCDGVVACALALPELGKLCLFSNNGSLYLGKKNNNLYFSSERFPLLQLNCNSVHQVSRQGVVLDIPVSKTDVEIVHRKDDTTNLIPPLPSCQAEESLLQYHQPKLRRCTKCILPETMPFIRFDSNGVCNYCLNYKKRNDPRPLDELFALMEPYRRANSNDCIVPFSGGRDSCYGLHLIVKELKMKPITYTYDWGMVTDLGRRNISRMSASLGVENIIVAANITKKRRNIARNLSAWLKAPNLGMVSILTAGDKHFFRHVNTVRHQTGISLNLWGVNPLEVTHFKSGFLGIPPDFEEDRVYSHGLLKQLRYQKLRFSAMLHSPSYFNSSLLDTLSGEYYRSFASKSDYFHIFDYWRWDEATIDNTLVDEYDWEKASDTNTTWRIGDGTAAIYNYIYYTVAGFTEHDTFRSNQIREGDITRCQALALVEDENRPRYPNIKWYLDAIGLDYDQVIPVINSIPKLY